MPYYQGWDLHPAQLPTRYAANLMRSSWKSRCGFGALKNFVEKAAKATLVRHVFDDAATGQGLLNYFSARDQFGCDHAGRSGRLSGTDSCRASFRSFR
jgi:hypothetical protein